jgi:hypothetical protein
LSNETISNLLEELDNWKKDLIRRLISMKDQNQQIFLLFYADNKNFDTDCLIEFLERLRGYFDDDDAFLNELIFRVYKWDRTFLHNFCVWLKSFDLLKFLKWFRDSFGCLHLRQLLKLRDVGQDSIIFNYFSNDCNSLLDGLDILNYLKMVCKFDESFLRLDVILQKSEFDGNILQQVFLRSVDLEQFMEFVEGFNIVHPELKSSFVGSETFIFYLAQKSEENQEKSINFLRRKFGGNFLDELISKETLYNLVWNSDRFDDFAPCILKFLDFVEQTYGLELLKNLISFRGPKNKTFLFPLHHEVDTCLMKILSKLLEKFKKEKAVLAELLLSLTDDGNTFLIHYLSKRFALDMVEISKELFNFIKFNFGLDFLEELLLIRNKRDLNFHLALIGNRHISGEKAVEVLDVLLEVVGYDKEFFVELTEQGDAPEPIREFLEKHFKIRRSRFCFLM